MLHKIENVLCILVLMGMPLLGQVDSEMPLRQKRLSDKVLLVWAGDHLQTIATVAVATKKGIIVIDTCLTRTVDLRIRHAIEKEFGRNDLKYLINTHYHHDHTAGNQVYADTEIIAHKNVPRGMEKELTGKGLESLLEKFKGMLEEAEKALKSDEPLPVSEEYVREFVAYHKSAVRDFTHGFVPTYPTILFEKTMMLDMGDVTIEVYSFIRGHTDSDIMVCVPEEGLVALGDVTPEKMLPSVSEDMGGHYADTMEHWGKIVDGGREIKYVHMAHSDMYLSVETFKEQYRYLRDLWEGLSDLHSQGIALEDARKIFTIEDDFPYFKDKITETGKGSIHERNIEAMWKMLSER